MLGFAVFELLVVSRSQSSGGLWLLDGVLHLLFGGMFLALGLKWRSSLGKPLLTVAPGGIQGVNLAGHDVDLPAAEVREVLGGGDNLRVGRKDGRVEAFSMLGLSEDDRVAALETAKEVLHRAGGLPRGPAPSTMTRSLRPR